MGGGIFHLLHEKQQFHSIKQKEYLLRELTYLREFVFKTLIQNNILNSNEFICELFFTFFQFAKSPFADSLFAQNPFAY